MKYSHASALAGLSLVFALAPGAAMAQDSSVNSAAAAPEIALTQPVADTTPAEPAAATTSPETTAVTAPTETGAVAAPADSAETAQPADATPVAGDAVLSPSADTAEATPVASTPAPAATNENEPKVRSTRSVDNQGYIEFEDKNLEALIKDQLKITDPNKGITEEQAQSVRILEFRNKNVTSLKGLEHFTGVATVNLEGSKISDITPLASMKNLSSIQLSGNNISDLSPLKNLENVSILAISRNPITDLTPIEGFKKIDNLQISGTQVTDLTSVGKLTTLTSLDISQLTSKTGKEIDPAPLKNLVKLKRLIALSNKFSGDIWDSIGNHSLEELNLYNNELKEIKAVPAFKTLKIFSINQNPDLKDFSMFTPENFPVIEELYASSIPNIGDNYDPFLSLPTLRTLQLNEDGITDASKFAGHANFAVVAVNDNHIKDLSPLSAVKTVLASGQKVTFDIDKKTFEAPKILDKEGKQVSLTSLLKGTPQEGVIKDNGDGTYEWVDTSVKEIAAFKWSPSPFYTGKVTLKLTYVEPDPTPQPTPEPTPDPEPTPQPEPATPEPVSPDPDAAVPGDTTTTDPSGFPHLIDFHKYTEGMFGGSGNAHDAYDGTFDGSSDGSAGDKIAPSPAHKSAGKKDLPKTGDVATPLAALFTFAGTALGALGLRSRKNQ